MLCDYFLSSVTEGLQPNAEESGTGLQEASHGGFRQAHIQRHTHQHKHIHMHAQPPLDRIFSSIVFFYCFHLWQILRPDTRLSLCERQFYWLVYILAEYVWKTLWTATNLKEQPVLFFFPSIFVIPDKLPVWKWAQVFGFMRWASAQD